MPESNNDNSSTGDNSSSGANTNSSSESNQQSNSENNSSGETGGADTTGKFTQAAVDEMIEDRLNRERKRFADYDEIKAERDKLKQGQESDNDKAVREAKDTATAEVTADFELHLKKSAVQLAATGLLADPADAVRFLDLDDVALTGKDIDTAAVTTKLKELVETKPYLGLTGTSSSGGSGNGGEQSGGNEGASLEEMPMEEYRKHRGLS